MYLEGIGIRSIERLERIPNPLIIKWVRRSSNIVRQAINEAEVPDDINKISILELDELFTHCRKN